MRNKARSYGLTVTSRKCMRKSELRCGASVTSRKCMRKSELRCGTSVTRSRNSRSGCEFFYRSHDTAVTWNVRSKVLTLKRPQKGKINVTTLSHSTVKKCLLILSYLVAHPIYTHFQFPTMIWHWQLKMMVLVCHRRIRKAYHGRTVKLDQNIQNKGEGQDYG